MWLEHRTQVGTLRIRGADVDVPALRLAVSGRLQTAELNLPASAPPSAILLIRRLGDPLPGRFSRTGAPSPDRDWDRAAQNDLASFYRIASRPYQCELPADAPAIVFRDRAELIAAAALYLARGGQPFAWWWQALARLLPPGSLASVDHLLTAVAGEVPAALAELVEQEQEVSVLQALREDEARLVLERVVDAFSLGHTAAEVIDATRARAPAVGRGSAPTRDAGLSSHISVNPIATVPPWRDWLPASRARSLRPHQELLLGTALGLQFAPQAVRRTRFWRRVAAWRITRSVAKPYLDKSEKQPLDRPDAETPLGPRSPLGAGKPASSPIRARPIPAETRTREISARSAGPRELLEAAAEHDRADPLQADTRPGRSSDALTAPGSVESGPAAVPPETKAPRTRGWNEGAVETEIGGAFYLVNVMTALDLPEIFEDGWRLASSLGGWGTLDVLTRLLASELLPPLEGEPLWRLLARLGGRRPDSAPSLDLEAGEGAPAEFAVPARWRVELRLEGAGATPDFERPLLAVLDPNLRRWLAGAAPYATQALAQATGVERPEELAELLRLRARIFVTATHIDIVSSLAGISLVARQAGLDRDPGWMPALGRIIQFHFH